MSQTEASQSWPLPPAGAPELGNGRYRLAVKLGEGGMASVYRAWDKSQEQWVAIKVLLPEFARRRKLRRRFENEARTMLELEHRHVVRVLDVGEHDALPFIVMELASGGCVIDWVEHYGPMPPRMAVDVVMQACKGLKAAHEANIVHRDVKPHNILITRRGVCRLTDFGIAQVEDTGGMTKTGSVMGTLGYMAPEQRTDSKNVDHRADIYGLGATLYKLLTGGTVTDLFLAEHDAEILDGVPKPLVPVLVKATAYKPEQRHPNVVALAKALHHAKQELPPDPEDTPGLALDTSGIAYDPSVGSESGLSEPTFAELPSPLPDVDKQLAAASDQTLAPPSSDLPGMTPAPVSYQMPKQDARRADDEEYVPDYIDKDSLPQHQGGFEIDVDEESKKRADAAFKKAVAEGLVDENGVRIVDDDSERPRQQESSFEYGMRVLGELLVDFMKVAMKPLQYIVACAVVVTLVVGISVSTSAAAVNEKMVNALAARKAFYSTIDANEPIVGDLEAMGGDPGILKSFWFDYTNAQTKKEKVQNAYELTSRLHATNDYTRKHNKALPGNKVRLVRERLNRIDAAQKKYEDAMLAWELEADGSRGRLAVSFGAATSPDDELASTADYSE